MFDVSREEITGGSLSRTLLVLAAPLVVQNFALVAQSVVDLFWVGRLGGTAVAAVGLSAVVVALLQVPLRAFFTGSQVVTSQRVGSDDVEAGRLVPFNAAFAAILVALVLGGLLVLAAGPLVSLFGLTGQVAEYAVSYLTASAFALVAIGASDTLESGFTGWGDTRGALYVNLSAIVVNLIFDPLLILGIEPFPRLEVFGAAIATGIGYTFGALFALALAYRGRQGFRLTREALTVDLPTIREVVTVGAPIAGQSSGRQVARLVIIAVVATVGGAPGLAAYYLGWQVATIAFVPASGVGEAATSIVGQNLGAEQPDRARRATWLGVVVAVVGLSVMGVLQWRYPAEIARVFVPGMSGEALDLAVLYLKILAYGYWALGAIYTVEAGFNGASRTRVSMVSTLVQYWAVRVPVALVGAFLLGLDEPVVAVFWGVTLSNIAAALWLCGYYHYSSSNGMNRRAAEEAAGAAGD